MFLQAAGMPARLARVIAAGNQEALRDGGLRALLSLAVRVTNRPAGVSPAEVGQALTAVGSGAEYLDAVGVMVSFNFITRVANALGVSPELPSWLRRLQFTRDAALRLASIGLRWLVDLRPRPLPLRTADENLRHLARLFERVGLGPLPAFFYDLAEVPHLLESQRQLLEVSLDTRAANGLDLDTIIEIGRVVLDDTVPEAGHGRQSLRQRLAGWSPGLGANDRPAGPAARGEAILRMARDVSGRSYQVTQGRVDELRALGLSDEAILDLVCVAALWSASARLEILLERSSDSSVSLTEFEKVPGGHERAPEGSSG